jgi:HK97 family phage major capsid protein
MLIDTFPHDAMKASELRTMGLLGRANAGPTLIEHLRDLVQQHGPQKRRISSAALRDIVGPARRDLNSTSAPAGAYLVGVQRSPIEELLARYSLLGDVTTMSDLTGPVTIPRVKTVAVAAWLAADGNNIVEADPVFGQLALAPKFCSVKIDVSRQLLVQSDAERVVGVQAAEAVARAVDTAIIAGSGSAGQPTGITNTSGVFAQAGASLATAGLRAMRKAVLLAGAREDRLLWVGAPDVQETLGGREFSAGSGRVLWSEGKIEGIRAVSSSLVPAGVLVLGAFDRVTAAIFDSSGVALEWNPYENFQTGLSSFRLILPIDLAVSPPACFAVATAVT